MTGRTYVSPDRSPDPGAGQASDPAHLLAWLGLALLTVYAIEIGGGFLGIYGAPVRAFSVLLIALGLGTWLVAMWRHPAWRPATVLWPAFAACLVVFGVSLAASRTPRYGADCFAYAILLTALYLLLVRLMNSPFFRPRLGAMTVALCLVTGAWYVIVVGQDWMSWWSLVGRLARPPLRPQFESLLFGNPSAVLTICVLLFVGSAAFLGLGTRARQAAVGGLGLVTLTVVGMSGGRAGWMAVAVGTVVTALAWLVLPEHRRSVATALASLRARVALAVVLLAGGLTAVVFAPSILVRALSGGEDLRAGFYLIALRIFESSPLLGTGPGTWVAQRIRFTLPTETDYYIPHAHDIYLQTLAEFGVLGALAGLIVVVYLAWLIRDGIRDPDPVRRRFGWAALFATVYFGTHQLLDVYANMPAALLAFAIPIAWLDATANGAPLSRLSAGAARISQRLRPVPVLGGLLAVVLAIGWLGWSESSALEMSAGLGPANAGNWSAALPHFRLAALTDPGLPPYHFALGLAEADIGDWRSAAAEFDRVAVADDLPTAWLDLAAARGSLGDVAGERAALGRALVLGYQSVAVNLDAGVLYVDLGDRAGAIAAFGRAVAGAPSLAGDPWWQADPTRAELWPEIYRAALADAAPNSAFVAAIGGPAPDVPFYVALSGGATQQAAVLAASVADPAIRALLQQVVRAWGGDPSAIANVYARAHADPLDMTTVLWCARVAEHVGDAATAQRFRSWADDLNGGAGWAATNVRVVARASGRDLAGINSEFYGQYTYRRPTPWDQIVSVLPHLAYE